MHTQMVHLLFCCAASLLATAGGVRIAVVSVPLHVKDLMPAAALLADMGHSVTIASASDDAGTATNLEDKCKAAHPSLTFTDVGAIPATLNVSYSASIIMDPNTPPPTVFAELARYWGGINAVMAEKLAVEWAQGSAGRPDYIVTDFLTFAGIDVADALGIPYGIVSTGPPASTADMLGVHYGQAAWVPLVDVGVQQRVEDGAMSWASRLGFGLIKPVVSRIVGFYGGRYSRNPVRAKLGLPAVSLWLEAVPLIDGAQPLVIVSRFPGLDTPIPLPPNWLRVAPISTRKGVVPPPLDAATATWFEGFPGGVVVVAFGRVTTLSPEATRAIVGAAKLLQHHGVGVYWGLRSKSALPGEIPTNLRVEEWIAQPSALGHPNTRAFVTHGGVSSINEGLNAGLPLLVAPGGGDQPMNAALIEDGNLGLSVDRNEVSSAELAAMVLRLSKEPLFKDRAELLRRLSQRSDGAHAAATAIESAALLGTLHLTAKVDSMHWILRNDYDVLAVMLLLGYVVVAAASRATSTVVRLAPGSRHRVAPEVATKKSR